MATQEELLQQIKPPEELISDVERARKAPELPAGAEVTPTPVTVKDEEIIATDPSLDKITLEKTQADLTNLEVPVPQKVSAAEYQTYTVDDTPEAVAAQGKLSKESILGDVQGAVSQESLVQAEQGVVNEKATIKYQLGELFKSFEEGKPAPPWAAPAVRNIGAMMAQRGLGSSSMAAAAITQAIMEAGIPIAAQEAQTYSAIDIANLNNRQQATLQNAATYAGMDKANLDNRTRAAVTNAQSFLNLDLQNLSTEQRVNEINFQSEMQQLFTNQAGENAARQFNAQSQAQVDQFFAEMEVQVANANRNRVAAQEQFNINQGNAMRQFEQSVNDARDRFEIQMRAQIDQSNAQWRRDTNTRNTAQINEANRLNAQNVLGLSTQAQNNLWQRYRDESAWLFNLSESAAQRDHEIGLLSMRIDEKSASYSKELRNSIGGELGKTVIRSIFA